VAISRPLWLLGGAGRCGLETGGALPEGARRSCAWRSLRVHVSAARDRWVQARTRCDPRLRDLRRVQASRDELSRSGGESKTTRLFRPAQQAGFP